MTPAEATQERNFIFFLRLLADTLRWSAPIRKGAVETVRLPALFEANPFRDMIFTVSGTLKERLRLVTTDADASELSTWLRVEESAGKTHLVIYKNIGNDETSPPSSPYS